jgi:predicted SnoaL-like aldol condensation-catalyzing enzyme
LKINLEENKKNVQKFYNFLINKKDFKSASKYIGRQYIQHNPLIADGPGGLEAFVKFLKKKYPDAKSEIKRIFAEGDYVILHVHSIRIPDTRGRAIFELFRLEKGKIVEHWDTIQEIPEMSANPNGMF